MDEEAEATVREVFTLFSQGYGKTAIARMLNDRGIPNPTEYKLCTVCATDSPIPETALYGNTLLSLTC
ncbi:recombinase family protein [Parablautia intestinalis]|uniref:recombinase family protein n=1 Tax=Parablautia intestinalis TaxID=2320100 RepID=UPI00256F360A|nr:recombinase family protein [Parablautia intestinalis]